MKQYEASARTVEEAIELGLQELGVSIGDVDVRVVEEGSKGLFGLFGSRMAKVCLTVKASEEDPLGNLLEEKKPAKRDSGKKTEAAPHVVIQSPMGGSITPEEIIKKTGPVDAVYVRVDENKAYWVRGDETGSVDLW